MAPGAVRTAKDLRCARSGAAEAGARGSGGCCRRGIGWGSVSTPLVPIEADLRRIRELRRVLSLGYGRSRGFRSCARAPAGLGVGDDLVDLRLGQAEVLAVALETGETRLGGTHGGPEAGLRHGERGLGRTMRFDGRCWSYRFTQASGAAAIAPARPASVAVPPSAPAPPSGPGPVRASVRGHAPAQPPARPRRPVSAP